MNNATYYARQFNLSGLNGISDQTLEMHFKHEGILYREAVATFSLTLLPGPLGETGLQELGL